MEPIQRYTGSEGVATPPKILGNNRFFVQGVRMIYISSSLEVDLPRVLQEFCVRNLSAVQHVNLKVLYYCTGWRISTQKNGL